MPVWAYIPSAVGQPPSYRAVSEDEKISSPEIRATTNPADLVTADDGVSLRPTKTSERLESLRDMKRRTLRAARDQLIETGVRYKGARFYSDRQSINDVAQAMTGFLMLATLTRDELAALPAPPPTSVRWKTQDGHVDLTPKEVAQLLARLSVHQQTAYALEEQALDRLAATDSEAAIAAVALTL